MTLEELKRTSIRRVPIGISVVLGLLGLGLAGCVSTALAQTDTSLPAASLSPSALPSGSPTPVATPHPLPIRPPEIIAEAGILPTNIFSLFDRLSEAVDRNIFSFGIPTLRARIALTQAAERIAELQALERNGRLTPAAARALLKTHGRLLAIADAIVARRLADGNVSPGLFTLLLRTRLAAAEVLEELEEERTAERELEEDTEEDVDAPSGTVPEEDDASVSLDDEDDDVEDFGNFLNDEIEKLVAVEEEMVALGAPPISPDILRILAEQKIAKAERDLLRAAQKTEERLVHGNILIADTELRAAADAALVTARQLFAAGNFTEALRLAQDARGIAGRLQSGEVAVRQHTLRSPAAEQKVRNILRQLVERGAIGTEAEQAALQRARQAIERAQANRKLMPVPPRGEGSADLTTTADQDENTESDQRGSRGSDSGSGSSGSGTSGSGR